MYQSKIANIMYYSYIHYIVGTAFTGPVVVLTKIALQSINLLSIYFPVLGTVNTMPAL